MATCPFSACGILSTLASRDSAVLDLGSLKIHDILHDRGYRVNFVASSDHTVWYTLRAALRRQRRLLLRRLRLEAYSLKDDRLVLEGIEAAFRTAATTGVLLLLPERHAPVGTKLPDFPPLDSVDRRFRRTRHSGTRTTTASSRPITRSGRSARAARREGLSRARASWSFSATMATRSASTGDFGHTL